MTRPNSTRSLSRRRRRSVSTGQPVRPVVENADGLVTFANPGDPTPAEQRRYAAAVSGRLPDLTPAGQPNSLCHNASCK